MPRIARPQRLNQRWLMPQSHPTTGPVRFLSPVRFLALKAEWSARRNFTSVLVLVVISVYGPRTARHGCTLMVGSNDSQDSMDTPCGARTGIVRAPQGNLQCFSYPTGPVRGPLRTRKGINTTRIDKKQQKGQSLQIAPSRVYPKKIHHPSNLTEWPLLQPHTHNQSLEGRIGLDLYLVEGSFKIQYYFVFVSIYILWK